MIKTGQLEDLGMRLLQAHDTYGSHFLFICTWYGLCLMRPISTVPLDNVIMSSEKQPIRLRQPLTSCGEMHLLPCSVQMERVGGGPARVDSYFAPLVREENEVTASDMKGNHSNL